jgi:hypothetical protein
MQLNFHVKQLLQFDFYKSVLAGTVVACADFKHAVLHDALLI